MFIGGLGLDQRQTASLHGWASEVWPGSTALRVGATQIWSDGRGANELIEQREPGEVLAVDGIVRSAKGRSVELLFAELRTPRCPIGEEWDGSYSLAWTDGTSVVLALDPAGIRRCFKARRGRAWVFGSLQAPLAAALGLEPDLCGVTEQLTLHATFGRRTLFTDLDELLPGEVWRLDADGSTLIGREHLISEPGVDGSPRAAAERLMPVLVDSARLAEGANRPTLALSGGLDSRIGLAALLAADQRPARAFTYGDAGEYEVKIARRVASAAAVPLELIDMRGRMFPNMETARSHVRATEALIHPAWVPLSDAATDAGSELLLLGDILDSLQVRGESLWGRGARLRQRLVGHLPDEPSLDEWWSRFRASAVDDLVKRLETYAIDLTASEMTSGFDADLAILEDQVRHLRHVWSVEEAVNLLAARHRSGAQPRAVWGSAVGLAPFATRRAATAGYSIPIELRAGRQVLDELARRFLPASLRRIPTATIPMVRVSAPSLVLDGTWFLRHGADQALRRLNLATGGRVRRDRLLPTQDLRPDYKAASTAGWGERWHRSDAFDSRWYAKWVRSIGGDSPGRAMVPISHMNGLTVDEILASARSVARG